MKPEDLSPEARALKKKLDELNHPFRPDRLESGEDFLEMLEYPWVQDMERVVENTKKIKTGSTLLADQPKVPINLVLTVMKEATERPEVMAAYASAPVNGQIPKKQGHLLNWFVEYVGQKYGNKPNPILEAFITMRCLVNNEYKGLEDPNLIEKLLSKPLIAKDDGENYE